MPDQSFWFLVAGGVLCFLGALVGALFQRQKLEFANAAKELRGKISSLSRRNSEIVDSLSQMQAEHDALSSFLVVLPDVVRRLNTNMSKRSIPPLLASTLQHLFEPSQILIYTSKGNDELVLTFSQGVPDTLRGRTIRYGHGVIGLVARTQMTMVEEDIQSESIRRGFAQDAEPHGFIAEMIAPIVHEGETLGVICLGGVTRHQRDEKRMLKLVADLGSLALNNCELLRKWESIANADSLTRLATKRYMNIRLAELMHAAEQDHTPLSLIILDLDKFKNFNDTYGHLAGDELLRKMAAILCGQLRNDDLSARYGGEEFVVVLPHTTKEEACSIAEKIRSAIERHPFELAPGKTAHVSISGGVASHPVDGRSCRELLAAADQALYLAKEKGRNRIVSFQSRYLSEEDEEEAGMGTL